MCRLSSKEALSGLSTSWIGFPIRSGMTKENAGNDVMNFGNIIPDIEKLLKIDGE
jgi:hypothetical protein